MNQDEEYTKGYRKIAAAEELSELHALLTLYCDLYKKKFRAEPIFPVSNAHMTQIKDFKKLTGQQAYAILQTFFSMHDDWFIKQQYSLSCLMQNINKVNAEVARHHKQRDLKNKIQMQFYCDCCWEEFTLICDMNFAYTDNPVKCEKCKQLNRPLKKVSKEERRRAILKLGAMFPEMPL